MSHMTRIKQFPLEEVLPHIGKPRWKIEARAPGAKKGRMFAIRMGTQRMLLIGRTQECACCGIKGHHFWLEHSGFLPPHLNLYAQNQYGHFVLMTMDHIVPKSKGGKTEESNIQLLCTKCNQKKKNELLTIEELRKRLGVPVEMPKTDTLCTSNIRTPISP